MDPKQELLQRINDRSACISLIGLGYVGLPLAIAFAEAGFSVTGHDVNENKCAQINAGSSYVGDIPDEEVARCVEEGCLQASSDPAVLSEADVVIICVPTPLSKSKAPDISYILSATDSLVEHVHGDMLIVLESTTYPGTTREILLPRLIDNGYAVGEDIFLAFSPERVDPGNERYTITNTPKVVGGLTPACQEVACALYGAIIEEIVPVSSPEAAEMTKLLENTFRAVNIGLINEMAQICHRIGIDVWEVVEAAATKPFGFTPFYPGPGLGGHCIPIDPLYLTWKMRGLGEQTRFIELADVINTAMPRYVVSRVQDVLNEEGKPLNGSRILVLGVAYKPDVGDLRESPALAIIPELQGRGAIVSYNDPYIGQLELENGKALASQQLTAETLRQADLVLIHTNHSSYDWDLVAEGATMIFDTRNALRRDYAHVHRL